MNSSMIFPLNQWPDQRDKCKTVGEIEEEDKYDAMALLMSWPNHLEDAIEFLNNCILPNLKFTQ